MTGIGRVRAAVAVLVVAVIAGGSVALYLALREHRVTRLSAERAAMLSKELSSGRAAELRDAVAMPQGTALDRVGIRALTTRSFKIEQASFRRVGSDEAYVVALVDGAHGPVERWQVLLVYSNGLWKLGDTHRAPA